MNRKGRDLLAEWGYCTRCLYENDTPDFRTCSTCRSYARRYYQKWYARPRRRYRRTA